MYLKIAIQYGNELSSSIENQSNDFPWLFDFLGRGRRGKTLDKRKLMHRCDQSEQHSEQGQSSKHDEADSKYRRSEEARSPCEQDHCSMQASREPEVVEWKSNDADTMEEWRK